MNPRSIINALLCVLASCGGSGGKYPAGDAGRAPSRSREPAGDAALVDAVQVDARLQPGDAALVDAVQVDARLQPGDAALVVDATPVDARTLLVCQTRPLNTETFAYCGKAAGKFCFNGTMLKSGAWTGQEPVLPCRLRPTDPIYATEFDFLARSCSAEDCASGFEVLQ
jgi:hypothetical protein